MRLAIIAMQGAGSCRKNLDYWQTLKAGRHSHVEAMQAIALARQMRDGGKFAPMLICCKNTPIQDIAQRIDLPHMAMKSGGNVADIFHLWNWQRKHGHMVILALGTESLPLARRLAKIRRKEPAKLMTAFFLRPPQLDRRGIRTMEMAQWCLCGSEFVKNRILEDLEPHKIKQCPKFIVRAPGIDLDNFSYSSPWDETRQGHFIFGMLESLQPRSGALLVVRAMSALWQKEDLPPWEVRMFGSGPRFEEVMEEATNLGVASRLSILGDQTLGPVISQCHAWLAPGTSPEELPQTLGAGFASSLPVICTRSDLHRERLEGAPHAALRIGMNNPQEMARAMIGLMRDGRLRDRLILAGERERFKTGLEYMAEKVCAFLEEHTLEEERPASHKDTGRQDTEAEPAEAGE